MFSKIGRVHLRRFVGARLSDARSDSNYGPCQLFDLFRRWKFGDEFY